MRRTCVAALAFASMALPAFSEPASAQKWNLENDELPAMTYRNADRSGSMVSVTCGGERGKPASEISIPVDAGVKPPTQAPEIRIKEKAGVQTMKLQWDVCGGEMSCSDRPNGDVSTFFIRTKDKQLALRFAESAISIEFDIPGAKLSAAHDDKVFASFAAQCRKY